MARRFRSRWSFALASSLLALLLTGGVASAALHTSGYVTRTKVVTFGTGDIDKSGSVKCPTGDMLVSGGAAFSSGDGAQTPIFYYLTASAPTGGGTGWYAAGYRAGTHSIGKLTIVVHCLPAAQVGAYHVAIGEFAAVGSQASGFAACASGDRVVTGGVWWAPTFGEPSTSVSKTILQASRADPDANGWYGSGSKLGLSAPLLHVRVLCLPAAAVGTYTVVARRVHIPGDDSLTRARTIHCPSGQRIISGGVAWYTRDGQPAFTNGGYYLSSDGPSLDKRSWRAAVWSSHGPDASLHFVALCRPL